MGEGEKGKQRVTLKKAPLKKSVCSLTNQVMTGFLRSHLLLTFVLEGIESYLLLACKILCQKDNE